MARAYGKFIQHLAKADFDVDTMTLGALLVTSAYTPNYDTDEFRAGITGEITGTGYTAGGITLTGQTFTLDTTNHLFKMDADDADFGIVTITGATGMIVYGITGSAATDMLMSYHPLSPAQNRSSARFKYIFSPNGIGTISY